MNTIHLNQRDRHALWLLSCTQASAELILKAMGAVDWFDDSEPFQNERRVRERMQAMIQAGLARSAPIAMPSGGVANWYRLTVAGYRTVGGLERALPTKTFFEPIRIPLQSHATRLAEAIVHTLVESHRSRVALKDYRRENELLINGGIRKQFPDSYFRFQRSGYQFNVMLELDNGTEPIDSLEPQSIREKILTYEAHQDATLTWWRNQGCPKSVNPRFRTVFLTKTAIRAEHIVALAGELAQNKDRLVCFATTLDDYLSEDHVLRRPIFLDHHGRWQSLMNIHPTTHSKRTPVRLAIS